MKKFAFCAVMILTFAMQILFAQQAAGPKANLPDRLSDDDGGVVQIVPVDPSSAASPMAGAAPIMKAVRQVSIFLGTAWVEQEARGRERILSDLSGKLQELQNSGATVLPAGPSVEDFTDLARTPMNDLAIQRKLTEMLTNKAVPAPNRAIVYVVFLAAGVKSSVGGHVGAIDYAAYHTSIHVDGSEVRYVVVPFNDNADRQAEAASRAIVQTAFDPGN